MLRLLVGTRIQVLFHSPPGVLFTFPSRYLSTIGHQHVFSLGEWSPQIQTGFHVSGLTQVSILSVSLFAYGTVTLCRQPFQVVQLSSSDLLIDPTTPLSETTVWALPPSLAATKGISFDFFSSAYLDVSVRQVSLP